MRLVHSETAGERSENGREKEDWTTEGSQKEYLGQAYVPFHCRIAPADPFILQDEELVFCIVWRAADCGLDENGTGCILFAITTRFASLF